MNRFSATPARAPRRRRRRLSGLSRLLARGLLAGRTLPRPVDRLRTRTHRPRDPLLVVEPARVPGLIRLGGLRLVVWIGLARLALARAERTIIAPPLPIDLGPRFVRQIDVGPHSDQIGLDRRH